VDGAGVLAGWLRRPRYEVLPLSPGRLVAAAAELPPEVTLTVTASAARGLDRTLEVVERLAGAGRRSVPHLAARLVRDEAHLASLLWRLRAAGVDEAFVVGGDAPAPAGPYADARSLLEAMAALGHPFSRVGVAGHPERHPAMGSEVAMVALREKQVHAAYVVSNLCLDAAAIARWVAAVRADGVTLPVHLGLPGPVDAARLARVAARIGLAESARFLCGHADLARLAAPGAYSPDRLVSALAARLADPALGVAGLHVFTFNELAATERWRQRHLG
jgi:methylenetetrahydrofolate reductase (NADPH)